MGQQNLIIGCGFACVLSSAALAAPVPGVQEVTKNGLPIDPDDISQLIEIVGPIIKPGFTTPLAPPVTINIVDTRTQFSLRVSGGNIGANTTQTFNVIGGFWTGTISITQDAAETFLNDDVLSVTGTIQHVDGPHNDDGLGGVYSFGFVLDGDDLEQVQPPGATGSSTHPNQHVDNFTGPGVTFTTVRNIIGDDITGYSFVVSGVHVPLPAAAWMVMGGLAMAAPLAKRLRG